MLGRAIGAPDLSGLFTLNLGVICLKRGDFDRARELVGESLAQFAAVKNSERQLFALLNLAHLDRERGESETAAELYEAAESLARRIGQDDVEIGALAGRALALAALGRHGEAEVAATAAVARGETRRDWFQGRELVESLALKKLCEVGNAVEALDRFERSVPLAEAADLYGAAWLAVAVAPQLMTTDSEFMRGALVRYAEAARRHGYSLIAEQCATLAAAEGNVGAA
jgi:tetratricopeptide (TPR) repeat protein